MIHFRLDTKMTTSILSMLDTIKQQLCDEGYAWVEPTMYRSLLCALGAQESDLKAVEDGKLHSKLQPSTTEPDLFFKKSAVHNILLDDTKDHNEDPFIPFNYTAKSFQPAEAKEIVSDGNASVQVDRTKVREWNLPPHGFPDSSLSLAMAKLIKLLLPKDHHPQGHMNMKSNASVISQFLYRVVKEAVQAEPTPEGIHQDGYEITTITLIKRQNILKGGETRLWDLQQPIGYYSHKGFGNDSDDESIPDLEGFRWSNILLRKTLTEPWETVIFNDRLIKHEARQFFVKEMGKICYRDVIINQSRKPYLHGIDKMEMNGNVVTVV